jgi:RNA polymerase sigma factor (sigma-70 family)
MSPKVPTTRELDPKIIRQALHEEGPAARHAFEHVYWHYEPLVRHSAAWAARVMGYLHHMEELCQEVWCRLVDHDRRLLRYYDPTRGPLGSFLRRLSFQQAIKAIRRDQRQAVAYDEHVIQADELEDERTSAIVAQLIQSELYEKLMDRVAATLQDVDRMLLREVHLEQRSMTEVAAEHGLTRDQVYQRNRRLKKKLKRWRDELLLQAPTPESPAESVQAPLPPLAVIIAISLAALAMPELEDPGTSARDAWVPSTPAELDAT